MVFSKNIVKVGKAEILNGLVDENGLLTLYFSKNGNRVYKKQISLDGQTLVQAEKEPINATEVLPVCANFKIARVDGGVEIFNE